jgi:hypothetical protein
MSAVTTTFATVAGLGETRSITTSSPTEISFSSDLTVEISPLVLSEL